MLSYLFTIIVWNHRICIDGNMFWSKGSCLYSCTFSIHLIGMFNYINWERKLQEKGKENECKSEYRNNLCSIILNLNFNHTLYTNSNYYTYTCLYTNVHKTYFELSCTSPNISHHKDKRQTFIGSFRRQKKYDEFKCLTKRLLMHLCIDLSENCYVYRCAKLTTVDHRHKLWASTAKV